MGGQAGGQTHRKKKFRALPKRCESYPHRLCIARACVLSRSKIKRKADARTKFLPLFSTLISTGFIRSIPPSPSFRFRGP
jgi:hypothetical protein